MSDYLGEASYAYISIDVLTWFLQYAILDIERWYSFKAFNSRSGSYNYVQI